MRKSKKEAKDGNGEDRRCEMDWTGRTGMGVATELEARHGPATGGRALGRSSCCSLPLLGCRWVLLAARCPGDQPRVGCPYGQMVRRYYHP